MKKLTKTEETLLAEVAEYGHVQVDSTQDRRTLAMQKLIEKGILRVATREKCEDQRRGPFGRPLQGWFKHYVVWTLKTKD